MRPPLIRQKGLVDQFVIAEEYSTGCSIDRITGSTGCSGSRPERAAVVQPVDPVDPVHPVHSFSSEPVYGDCSIRPDGTDQLRSTTCEEKKT
jgi:hypothetical protein